MKYSVILVFLLLGMPLVMAEETIGETMITVKVYNSTPVYTNGSMTKIHVEIKDDKYPVNNNDFSFDVNFITVGTNTTAVNNISFSEEDLELWFIQNKSIGEDIVNKYVNCLNEKSKCEIDLGKWDISWTQCVGERDKCLEKYEGENATSISDCTLALGQKDNDLEAKDNRIKILEGEKETTKNSKWFYGVIGIVIGIIGLLVYQGKIGKSAKDKSEHEFNKAQQG